MTHRVRFSSLFYGWGGWYLTSMLMIRQCLSWHTESFQVTGIEDHRQVAEEIIKYVLRTCALVKEHFTCRGRR